MTFKLIQVKRDDVPSRNGLLDDYHFNHLPGPASEISEEEGFRRLFRSHPMYTDYRQVFRPEDLPDKDMPTGSYHLFYHFSYVLAIRQPHSGERPRFFLLGCLHKNNESRVIGRCLTKYTCRDCGFVQEIDSSD